ncbi:K+-sensing histidine kinase KdpD [Halorubrum alkaliphilum]|uniref:histidine kinase n=1 Tax=Halorubrum alkaliphilum TaxID=261290 RepID=A0A8T4GET0_9EURY|nr:ATP-binding protein [Halorubrum alkaliphilum]MBP1921702.1 K+-sensing histidine kinase KdpD [Halorubrum alkaliphilum]
MPPDHDAGILDAISDAALVVDEDGTIESGNGHVEAVFGRPSEALVGRDVADVLVDSGDPDEFSWDRYFRDPTAVSIADGPDLYARHASHREGADTDADDDIDESDDADADATIPVRIGLTPVDLDGETRVVTTVVDFSRERARNVELHRRTETLTALHGATQELLKTTDREAAAKAAVEYIDGVLGLSIAAIWLHDEETDTLEPAAWTDASDDLIGEHPTYTAGENSLSWEAFETGEPRYVPNVHDDPDRHNPDTPIRSELIVPLGRYGVLNVGSAEPDALDAPDRTVARLWGASVTMVFVRIERERQLRAREADVTRERDRLEEFASLVSHDLRTPLNVAAGHVEIARETTDGADDELATVASALDRMEAIIADLLTLARQGNVVDEAEPVRLATLVEEVRTTVGMDPDRIVVADDVIVSADRSRLAQLFENLLGNAVRHAGDDVVVTVGSLPDGDGFYVADDGPGIDPDRREEVFEAGVTTDDDGTGFGLKIVAEIADAHGWNVDIVESDDGGACFRFHDSEVIDADRGRSGG